MVTVLDERGLRLARDVRAAIRSREDNHDLQAAIEVYDRAVSAEERQAAASYLLEHSTKADTAYSQRVRLAVVRMTAPHLLRPEER